MTLTGYSAQLISLIQTIFLLIANHHWAAAVHHWPKHHAMRHHLWLLRQQVIWIMERLTGYHLVSG